MRLVAPQNFAIEHARQKDVVGKLRLASALCARIDFAEWFADYVERLPVVRLIVRHDCRGGACPRPIIISLLHAGRDKPLPLRSSTAINALAGQLHLFTTHPRSG